MRSVTTLVLVAVMLNITLLLLVLPVAAGATGSSSWNPGLLANTEAFQVIDDADTSANVQLKFGETLQESLTYNRTASRFEFTRSLQVGGNLTATGALSIAGTIAGSGTLAIEGNAALGGTVKLNGVTYTFPGGDGTASGKVLKTDSAGTLSWSTDSDSGVGSITAPTAEGMFVNQGGDTMTGALQIRPAALGEAELEVAGTASGKIISFGTRLTGSGAVSIRTLTDSVTAFQVLDSDGGTPVFNIDTTNERVGIGTASPAAALDVDGSIYFTGGSGDVNGDGQILTNDLITLRNHIWGSASLSREQYARADVTGDGIVNYSDYAVITAAQMTSVTDAMRFEAETPFGVASLGTAGVYGDEKSNLRGMLGIGLGTSTPGNPLSVSGAVVIGLNLGTVAADAGLLLEVKGTASGDLLHAQKDLSSSGTLAIEGNSAFGGTIKLNSVTYTFPGGDGTASGKVLKTDSAGTLSWSTDSDSGVGSITAPTAEGMFVNQGGDTMTGALQIRPATLGEAELEVAGTASGKILSFGERLTGSGSVSIRTLTDSATAFQIFDQDGGNPVFNVDTSNERVGIGTAAPETALEVTGTMSGRSLQVTGTGASPLIYTNVSNGRVGIGTSAPAVQGLHIAGAGGTYARIGNTTSNTRVDIGINGSSQLAVLGYNDSTSQYIDAVGKAKTWSLLSGTAGGTQGLYQDASGLVGIGTTTPTTKLEVVGTISGSQLRMGNATTSGSIVYSSGSTLMATAKGASGQILLSQGTAAPIWLNTASAMVWYIDGTLATGASQGATVVMPYGFTCTDVDLRVDTAPVGANLIVDINKGGATIFSTNPEIDDGATAEDGNHAFSTTDLSAGSVITLDIDQIGSGTAGSDLTVILKGTRKY